MERGTVFLREEVEVMKFEDGTWILYNPEKKEQEEPLVLNKSASDALNYALEFGVTEGLQNYLEEVENEFSGTLVLQEAAEDFYYTLDICKTMGFVDIDKN